MVISVVGEEDALIWELVSHSYITEAELVDEINCFIFVGHVDSVLQEQIEKAIKAFESN
jgi:hypothetical protein